MISTILLRNATVLDSQSPWNGKQVDLLIQHGIISKYKPNQKLPKNTKEIKSENLHVSIGWVDLQCNFCEPGYEHRETIQTGLAAAANGGYTAVAISPNTQPILQNKSEIEFVKVKAQGHAVQLIPLGALTQNLEGKELTEMYDMQQAGSLGFSDGQHPIQNAGVLMRALLYAKQFNTPLFTWCNDKNISADGKMNESVQSTLLGMKGIPTLAESVMVSRNLQLLAYTGGRLHISNVSTPESVDLIREAKAKGLQVSASVNGYTLSLTDDLLADFNSNLKVFPPLRSKVQQEALWKGIQDGTIDAICSDHQPQEIENKEVEFDVASPGIAGIETVFASTNTCRGKMSIQKLVDSLSVKPRKIMGLPIPCISEGAEANLTLFDPSLLWKVAESDLKSKSKNNPYIGKTLKGKVLGVYNNQQFIG